MVARRYFAPEKIYGWHWNADSGDLLLELRETDRKGCSFKSRGTLHMIDLQTKEEKWSRPINYRVSQVNRQDAYLFLTERKKNYCLDPETGCVLWECRNEFQFIDPRLQIGVGYPVDSPSDKLYAVDLFRRGSGAILLPMTTFNV